MPVFDPGTAGAARVSSDDDDGAAIGPIPSVRDLVAAGVLTLLGAAGCVLGLSGVIDTADADTDLWDVVLLCGGVIAAVSAGLVIVATQRRRMELRKLEAMTWDLVDDVRAAAQRRLSETGARALTTHGRQLRRLAIEAGARREADELSKALTFLAEESSPMRVDDGPVSGEPDVS